MATVELQGTSVSVKLLPLGVFSDGYWAKTEISLKNEYIEYRKVYKDIARDEIEDWIFAAYRLLAGAYGREYTLDLERAGISVTFCTTYAEGVKETREERRKSDCLMLLRFVMRSSDDKRFLDGVYTLVLHREDIKKFADKLRAEFDEVFARFVRGRGKYRFVGVSPLGYAGCNYWYLDDGKDVQAGDYVWVTMGRRHTEQIAYVDSVRYCSDDTAPYDPARVKRILRKATKEEIEKLP